MKNGMRAILLIVLLLMLPPVILPRSVEVSSSEDLVLPLDESVSAGAATWHDDCSSVDGWVEPSTSISGIIPVVQTGISLLTDGTGIYSDTIPGYADDDHGSIHVKKLDTPMALTDSLELKVEIEHLGTSGYMGSVGVFLLDAANESVFKVGGVDGWTGSTCNAWVSYRQDGSQTTEYNTKSGAWSGVVRVWYDPSTDSIKGDAAGVEYTLRTSGNFDPDRVVHFVGITFYNKQFYSFESDIVKDILVTVEPESWIWHHDCSNTTDLTYMPNWPMDWWYEEYEVTSGDMLSSGEYLYFSNIPGSSLPIRWHGPVFTHNFTTPFKLENLVNYSVHLDVDNSLSSYSGIIDVILFDTNYIPVIRMQCTDSWNWKSEGYNSILYWYANSTYTRHGTMAYTPWTTFNGTMKVWYDAQDGLMGYVPGYGEACLATPDQAELDREIAYVSIQPRRLTTYTWMPSSVRDIFVEARSETAIWHSNCSDSADFPDAADNSWFDNPNINVGGAIASNGDYLYPTDFGSGSVSHGPLFYHTLQEPFKVSQLLLFRADIEVDATGTSPMGAVAVYLFDENNNSIASLQVADSWSGYSVVSTYATWGFSNKTEVPTPWQNPTYTSPEPYRENLTLWIDETGVFGNFPNLGTYKVVDLDDIDLNRTITYVAVNFRSHSTDTPCQIMRIHDIQLEYRISPPTADTTPPSINGPDDFGYEAGASHQIIRWNVSDANPSNFWVTHNDTLIIDEFWDGSDINVNVTDFELGHHNITLYVNDTYGNMASDSVIVIVYDTTYPSIIPHLDIQYEAGATSYNITWVVYDLYPDYYLVYRNETLQYHGEWDGTTILVDIGGLDPGNFIYTLYVNDTQDQTASDAFNLSVVDTTSPEVNAPTDYEYELGSTGHSFIWSASELYPESYSITRDGVVQEADSWTGSDVTLNIDGLDLGIYEFTITFEDASGNLGIDTVIVTVVDTTAPMLDHPADLNVTQGETGHNITWAPFDLKPDHYRVYLNGTLIVTGNWDGSTITIDVNTTSPGLYLYGIFVYDSSGNSAFDIVIVRVGEDWWTANAMIIPIIGAGALLVVLIIAGVVCRTRRGPST